ncbi:hypothetical protein [Novosphingobium guangzhouense]|uniref:hypothetical protein n=1 Tax=Novosphingobium guangzhouense TaxID=1850347 RepID=UPI000CCBF7AC|nr:hypothetical protein [Novosphingobium guangzhouense]
MSDTRYRLGLAVTLQQMPDIAMALANDFPELSKAVEKQWLEIMNSGVNIFGPFEHATPEPVAGLTEGRIELMTGIAE